MHQATTKKILTVTVAVCAYNEEPNIKAFLNSVVKQKGSNFEITEILVMNDGSSDNTVGEVTSVKDSRITLVDNKARQGKSSLLNQIYARVNTAVLIQTDADVIFESPKVIEAMVAPIIEDAGVALVGGNHMPKKGITFTELAVNYTFEAFLPFRNEIRGGNNLFSVAGCILAMKKDFYKKLDVPKTMINNDVFTYYACLSMGYKYRYAPEALVIFRQPQTLKDQIKQNTRFLAGHQRMYEYYPKELVDRESFVPKKLRDKYMFKMFIKHPVHSLYIFIVNRYALCKAEKYGKQLDGKWYMAETTKSI